VKEFEKTNKSGKHREKGQQAVQDQSMMMEKSWIMMIDQTKSWSKLVPQVTCGIPEGVICDLETGVN